MKSNVTYWLDKTTKEYPEKIAFSDVYKSLTFKELRNLSLTIATGLVNREIKKSPIVIYMKKGVDMIAAFMGTAYSGNFYSPIDVQMPSNRINKILEVLQPKYIITTKELCANIEEFIYDGEILIWEDEIQQNIDEQIVLEVQNSIIDTDLLYVLFTSGSTGIPKGVSISHRSVIDYIDCVSEIFEMDSNDSFGNQAPFYFDNSILDIYCTIKNGAYCHILSKELFSQPVRLLAELKEKNINTIFWVPSSLIVVSKLKAFRNVDLNGVLKRVLFCGEVMPNKQLNIWRNYLPDIQYANLYGPTEITDACTYYIIDREFSDNEPLPIGIPMPNTDILVLNEDNKPVKEDELGELCVRGTSLALGYYNNPEKTKEAFVQNPLNTTIPELIYRTGDLVKYNERRELVYVSRKDFQIKHLGHRIELGEIENAVSSIPEISLCCCLYDNLHQKIVLFIDTDLDKKYIIEKISTLVPSYMYPGKVIKLDVMPINANGKIDRKRLGEML